jgi:hypothetical protein
MSDKLNFHDPKTQMAFVQLVWSQVAPFAYSRFLIAGRGCLYFDVADIKELTSSSEVPDARYVTIDDLMIPIDITERMKRYDPEKEVFFIFDAGTGMFTFYGKCFDEPSPQELYEANHFINDLWQSTAPVAFRNFLKHGRGGLLIVPAIIVKGGQREVLLNKPVQYVTSGKIDLPVKAVKELNEYVPEKEVCFLFDFGSGIWVYRRTHPTLPSPEELYKRQLTDLTNLATSVTEGDVITIIAPSSVATESTQSGDNVLFKTDICEVTEAQRLEQSPPYTFRFVLKKLA